MSSVEIDPKTHRIAPVDGLRAVAVLGVIWAHVWAFSGTPSLSVGHWVPCGWTSNGPSP